MEAASKPHAVYVTFPLSTHINSALKLAKLIHQKGFHITFITTESDRETILSSRGPNALDGLPDFRFQTLPIDIPPAKTQPAEYFGSVMNSVRKSFLPLFTDLIEKLNNDTSCPKVSCILSDGAMTQSVLVAEQLRIPVVLCWLVGANGFFSIFQYRDLLRRCLVAAKDIAYKLEEDLDTTIVDFLPGRKSISIREFLGFIQTTHSSEYITESVVGEVERTSKASALMLLSFEDLEKTAIDELKATYPHVYSIAPLPLLLKNQVTNKDVLQLIGDDIWSEDTECSKWLDSKPPKSVLYVSFGSFTVTSHKHLVEFAWGLAKSNQNFIWIVRPNLVSGDQSSTDGLPQGFLEEIKERGLILSWCQQEQVLNHPSVGGFLTHCGWNSVLESISAGVPMICWPFCGEHVTNCKMVCNEWGIGIKIDEEVKRCQVEKAVKEIIEGETGKKVRYKAKLWMKIAREATDPYGLSTQNLDKLVREVLLTKI